MNLAVTWQYAVITLHLATCVLLAIYGVHRYSLVYLYYKYRRNTPKKPGRFETPPFVTIQLPMFNEQYVARRIIEAACRIDYPRDRLEIQVLDDSTDETVEIARAACEDMRAQGHPVVFMHRDNREGYKAGALEAGLKIARGEFVVIFDADFVPPKNILHELIDYFVDPKVGMVQARWEHINRSQSMLTEAQAILLDGHFVIEHGARNRSGRFMSFNGTAGAWRKSCIEDAGGWQHDTLTEDLDLSYRAQLKGWEFVFLPSVTSPAELPPEMNGFKSQQHRWAKGGAQTCRKLLPRILKSRLPWRIKVEAFFHLTSCVSYFLILLLTFLLFPALHAKVTLFAGHRAIQVAIDVSLVLLATFSASTFYVASQREQFRTWADSIKYLPFLMSVGVGISLNNARAAFEGFFGGQSEFVRTPKFGVRDAKDAGWRGKNGWQGIDRKTLQSLFELAMAFYMAACIWYTVTMRLWVGLFFMSLFAAGYFYVAVLSLAARFQSSTSVDGAWMASASAKDA
ncbi:MAG TPA: glycosyltransferase family 2 protein [Phycisphaerae bacterium]|nr:glycosyltransferase family 2 protein [Phycisphaerae bacterium]HRW54571.1 glycosyltransferase family 2 protein [Phycisphaerae bacterium]